MSNGTIGSKAVRIFEAPIGNDFPTVGPKEPETDAVKCFVDTHVADRRGSMISRKDVASEQNRDNDEHQHFGVILNWLEDDQFTLNEVHSIMTDIIAVGLMKRIDIGLGEGGIRGQPLQQKLGVYVLIIRCKPVKRRGNWLSRRDGVNYKASDKFSGRGSSINKSKEMIIDEMIDKMGTKLERAASRKMLGVGGKCSSSTDKGHSRE